MRIGNWLRGNRGNSPGQIRDKAEAAHARTDLLERHRDLMEAWSGYPLCTLTNAEGGVIARQCGVVRRALFVIGLVPIVRSKRMPTAIGWILLVAAAVLTLCTAFPVRPKRSGAEY